MFLHQNTSSFSPAELQQLQWRQHNMQYLTIDNYDAAPEWRNVAAVPYATRFHFAPPSMMPPEAGGVHAWRPEAVSQHPRPLLASYIGKRSHKLDDALWQIKMKVCSSTHGTSRQQSTA